MFSKLADAVHKNGAKFCIQVSGGTVLLHVQIYN